MKRLSMAVILLLGSTMIASAWNFHDISTDNMRWQSDVPTTPALPIASCVAWGDINNDGAVDLFVGSRDWHNSQLYLNDGNGGFTDVSSEWATDRFTNIRSAQMVDYDQDGLLDLLLITYNQTPLELFRQTSESRLVSVPIDLSSEDLHQVTTAAWKDVNHDGILDMIVNAIGTQRPEVSVLVADDNAMTLDRDGLLPENIEYASNISLIDYNLDGYLDIFIGSTAGNSSFFINTGNGYDEMRESLGLPQNVGATGIAWADFNHDSYLDFATCGKASQTCIYMGGVENRRRVFYDVIRNQNDTSPGEIDPDFTLLDQIRDASSVHAVDANMDGWMDLFYVNAAAGCFLMLNDHGVGWIYDATINAMINRSHLPATSAAWADIDSDGDPDLALSCREDGIVLLENNLTVQHEYLSIKLAGYNTDTPILNCQMLVKFQDSASLWATTSMANSCVGYDNMVCQFVNPSTEHSRILSLTVIWPTGTISVYDISDVTLWGETTLRPPQLSTGGTNGGDISSRLAIPEPVLPAELTNAPNPFNPSTTLNYTVPEAGWVELSVINVLGQEVMSLVSGYADAGIHSVHFNAATLPSGMYIARLSTGGHTMLHRMLLTK